MIKISDFLWFLARIFVGLVFAYAGFSKLMEPAANFRGVLTQYEVIPYALVPTIAVIFPWLELVFGVFLILGYAPRVSALILAGFSFIFLIVLGSSKLMLGSVPISCGCFGEGGIHLTVRQVFFLDLIDAVLAIRLFQKKEHPLSLNRWLGGKSSQSF